MKKKELINKIDSLINSLNEMSAELKACRAENNELKHKIEELSKENVVKEEKPLTEEVIIQDETPAEEPAETCEIAEEPVETCEIAVETTEEAEEVLIEEEEPEKVIEKKVLNILPTTEEVILPDSMMEFGAEIIGKIVIESAKYADLVAASTTVNKKELLNLIMGKSEICKAEILNIVTSESETDIKISLINAQLSEATDYFKSVVAQI